MKRHTCGETLSLVGEKKANQREEREKKGGKTQAAGGLVS